MGRLAARFDAAGWEALTGQALIGETSGGESTADLAVATAEAIEGDPSPLPADRVALVGEVVSSGQDGDYAEKRKWYARSGIPLYLLVDPHDGLIELYSRPENLTYRRVAPYRFGDAVDLPEPFSFSVDTSLFRVYPPEAVRWDRNPEFLRDVRIPPAPDEQKPQTDHMIQHIPHSAPRYTPCPIPPPTLKELQDTDDAGRPLEPFTAREDGVPVHCVGSPLRCCLRDIRPGERIALVSYAPLRRWAAATGAEPGAYCELGPVFIHAGACDGPDADAAGYPFARAGALRTVRRYNTDGQIVGGRFFEIPEDAESGFDAVFDEAFADPEVALVHVRALEYGCFQYEVRRP
ncbi:hypothetical protein T261_5425 [Streptomyces lydicus]|nr:hypothetical protein T261_5425 [Streptomyces lydicus]